MFVVFFPPLSIPAFHEYIDEGKQADNATSGVSDLLHVFIHSAAKGKSEAEPPVQKCRVLPSD